MTSSPQASNILLDPVSELTAALKQHAFGIQSSELVLDQSFPLTTDDKQAVASSSKSSGRTDERVRAAADIRPVEGGEIHVVLDQRGYTIETFSGTTERTYPGSTFESLDALLIAVSPGYVQAMGQEVGARFAGMEDRRDPEEDETPEQASR